MNDNKIFFSNRIISENPLEKDQYSITESVNKIFINIILNIL